MSVNDYNTCLTMTVIFYQSVTTAIFLRLLPSCMTVRRVCVLHRVAVIAANTPFHPSEDVFTKLSFLNDSRPGARTPSVMLIRRLVRNKQERPIPPQTCIHLVLPSYTVPYLCRKIQHDMRANFALLKRGLIFLSFPQQPQSLSGPHGSCDPGLLQ